MNVIDEAERAGMVSNGPMGAQVAKALQVAYLLKAARQRTFDGRVKMRLRQNVFLTATAGIGKSFVTDFFFGEICGAKNVFGEEGGDKRHARVAEDDGATTFEKWRGGATSSGGLIRPLILDCDIVVVTELFAVIGEHPRIDMGKVRKWGVLAEEGRMSVSLQKLDEMDDETFEEFARKAGTSITVSRRPRGYRFFSDAIYVVLTTPLEEEPKQKLRKCGFLGRFDNVDVELTREEELSYLREFGSAGMPNIEALRQKNEDIWNTKVCPIPYPPKELLDDYAQAWLVKQADDISSAANISPLQVATLRDIGNVARLMAASALARIFAARKPGDRSPIESISYEKKDADFAIAYLTKHLNNLRISALDGEMSRLFDGIPDTAHYAMKRTLLEEIDEGDRQREKLPKLGRVEVFLAFCKEMGTSDGTAKNYLSAFRKAKLIKGGKYGENTFTLTNDAYAKKCMATPLPKQKAVAQPKLKGNPQNAGVKKPAKMEVLDAVER